MKLKNYEIENAIKLVGELVSLSLPIKTSWNLTKNIKKLESLYNTYLKFEQKLAEKYAQKNDDGSIKIFDNDQYHVEEKFQSVFAKEKIELMNCDNDVDLIKINVSDILDCDAEQRIMPAILLGLYFMFDEDTQSIQ